MQNNTYEIPVPKCFSSLVVSSADSPTDTEVSQSPSPTPYWCDKSEELSQNFQSNRSNVSHDVSNYSVKRFFGEINGCNDHCNQHVELINGAADSSLLRQQENVINGHDEKTSSFSNQLLSTLSQLDHDTDQKNMYETTTDETKCNLSTNKKSEEKLEELASESIAFLKLKQRKESDGNKSPFVNMNPSLLKLHDEMKSLRYIDISLFYQLVSLNESIQDFKMNMADRYSETGSEYSLGTASYMGSMSSLNEDSEWEVEREPRQDDEHTQDASSLLQQISDLAFRADKDF